MSGRVLLALLGLLATGCGYTAGLLVPDGARSVGVEVFRNNSDLRNIEVEVTDEVARSVADLVHLPLVRPEEADVVVRGTIAAYHRRGGVRDSDNRRLETAAIVTLTGQLVRRSTGAVLARSTATLSSGQIVENNVIADDVANEVEARDRALENLADRLVLELFGALSYEGDR